MRTHPTLFLALASLFVAPTTPRTEAPQQLPSLQQGAPAQKKTPAQQEDAAKLDKRVRDACGRNPLIRIQAARRVVKAKQQGVAAVRRFVKKHGANSLSAELVALLGKIEDNELRKTLRAWVLNRDFAWRPQALLSLATRAKPGEEKLFMPYLKDGSWLLRRAALAGMARIGGKLGIRALEKALADKDQRVAVHAAKLLLEIAEGQSKAKNENEKLTESILSQALPVLIRALDAEDPFFGDDFGYLARKEAFAAVRHWSGKDFGYRVRADRAARRAPIRRFAAAAKRILGREIETFSAPAIHAWSLGLERRSCREGDLVLRLDAQGHLWRGVFELEEIEISRKDRAELRRLARRIKSQKRRNFGAIRCDLFRFVGLGAAGNLSMRSAPDSVPDFLRPLHDKLLELAK